MFKFGNILRPGERFRAWMRRGRNVISYRNDAFSTLLLFTWISRCTVQLVQKIKSIFSAYLLNTVSSNQSLALQAGKFQKGSLVPCVIHCQWTNRFEWFSVPLTLKMAGVHHPALADNFWDSRVLLAQIFSRDLVSKWLFSLLWSSKYKPGIWDCFSCFMNLLNRTHWRMFEYCNGKDYRCF